LPPLAQNSSYATAVNARARLTRKKDAAVIGSRTISLRIFESTHHLQTKFRSTPSSLKNQSESQPASEDACSYDRFWKLNYNSECDWP